jgi:hypothetical protein
MSDNKKHVILEFSIEQEVTIKQIPEKPGVVTAVFLDGGSTQYKVRYFYEGDPKEVYFYAWELEESQ